MNRADVLTNSARLIGSLEKSDTTSINALPYDYKKFLSEIVDAYESRVIRAYCKARFKIININILQMIGLCLRGKRRILDVGCGFGLFGCYFSAMYPEISYTGYDLNAGRVRQARRAAEKLGLKNVSFNCGDARDLKIDDEYDAVLMVDLLHHINDEAKANLLETCAAHLAEDGRLIIKDVTTHPFPKIAFTWWLDVVMTHGFEMWYWNEKRFYAILSEHFKRVEMYPIVDWLPYPHVIYLCENAPFAGSKKHLQLRDKFAA